MTDMAARAHAASGHRSLGLRATLRTAAAQDTPVLVGLAVWTVLLAALTWGSWGDVSMDTGYDLLAGSRTAAGELPYADYVYYYGPLGPLLLGGLYAITGPAVWPAVALGLALAALAIWLTYRLARVFVAPLPAALCGALVASTALSGANNSYVLPHSTSAPLALVLALGAVTELARWARAEHPSRARLLLVGVLGGLAATSRPELAAALYAAVALWLALRIWRPAPGRRGTAWRDAGSVAAPALAIPALAYGAFLTRVSLHDLLFENLYPVDYLRAAGDVVLRLHAPWTAGSFAELAGSLLLYAAGTVALVAAGRALEAGGRRRSLVIAGLVLGALLFLAVLVARPDTVRYYLKFAYAWIPAGAWIAAAALAWRARRSPDRAGRAALAPILVLAAAATTTYAQFTPFPNALHPDATAYLMPLAAVFLAWFHVAVLPRGRATVMHLGIGLLALLAVANAGLVVADARPETTTVTGPHGSLTARPADGPALQQALAAIERYTRPGEPVLLAPQMTSLYVMSDRRDPLAQLSLLPGALGTAADEQRAIDRMHDVRLAVIDRTPQSTYGHGAFGTTFAQRLAAWLRTDFVRVSTARGAGASSRVLDIWIRRSP